jgi:hypothetical protein
MNSESNEKQKCFLSSNESCPWHRKFQQGQDRQLLIYCLSAFFFFFFFLVGLVFEFRPSHCLSALRPPFFALLCNSGLQNLKTLFFLQAYFLNVRLYQESTERPKEKETRIFYTRWFSIENDGFSVLRGSSNVHQWWQLSCLPNTWPITVSDPPQWRLHHRHPIPTVAMPSIPAHP